MKYKFIVLSERALEDAKAIIIQVKQGGKMLPEFYQFHHPTKMIYGEGLASDFSHELEALNVKKFFMVSDHVINGLGLLDNIKEWKREVLRLPEYI
jgi:hypothetical protein